MAWLIFTALRQYSPKPCFLEGGRLCLAVPLWAVSQCPSGKTAGRHIPQTPASFVILENGAHWYSEEYYTKSCFRESSGMLPYLAFDFNMLSMKCFFRVLLLPLHFLLSLGGKGHQELTCMCEVMQELYFISVIHAKVFLSPEMTR